MSICNPNQFSDFFLPSPPLAGPNAPGESSFVPVTNHSAFSNDGQASLLVSLTGTTSGAGNIDIFVKGPNESLVFVASVVDGEDAAAVANSIVSAVNGTVNSTITAAVGSPNSGINGNVTFLAKDYGQVGNSDTVRFVINGFRGITFTPTMTGATNLKGGFGQTDTPAKALGVTSVAGSVATPDSLSAQAAFEASVAVITLDINKAQNAMSSVILPAWQGIGGLIAAFSALGQGATGAAQLTNFTTQLNGIFTSIAGFKNIVTLFDSDPAFNQDLTDGLNYINTQGIQPLTNWVAQVAALSNFNSSGIDLSGKDGSLSALSNVVSGALGEIDKLDAPWTQDGKGTNIASWFNGVTSSWQNIVKVNDQVDQIVKDATAMVLASQALLLAACQAIPAIIAQMKNLYNALYALFHSQFDFSALFNLFKGFHFKFPSLPDFLHLKDFDGLNSALDGFGSVFARCGSILADANNALLNHGFPTAPNFNALSDAFTALNTIESKFTAGTVGIGSLTNGVPTALDPLTSLWQATSSLVGMAPNSTTITPEASGQLGPKAGGVAGTNASPSDLTTGACGVRASNISQVTNDPNTSGMPGPQQAVEGMGAAVGDLFGTLQSAQLLGTLISETAARMMQLGPNATEQDAKDALADFINAAGLQLAVRNAALNHTLDPQSLAAAAAQYWACKNAENHVSPTPTGPTDTGPTPPLSTPPGGSTGTPMASAQSNGNTTTPQGLVDDPVTTGVPSDYFDDGMKVLIGTYADPKAVILDYASLPYFFITQTQNDLSSYRKLKELDATYTAIFADPTLVAAHLAVLQQARQQFVSANSPYSWLGQGVEVLGAYLDTDGKPMSLTALVEGLLVHDARNLLPLANWLSALPLIDDTVPLPLGLTELQFNLADQSYQYTEVNRLFNFVALLTSMRINADTLGASLGFEYCLVLATFVLMNRMKGLLSLPGSTSQQVAAVAQQAKMYLNAMTNGQDFIPMLDAIVAGA